VIWTYQERGRKPLEKRTSGRCHANLSQIEDVETDESGLVVRDIELDFKHGLEHRSFYPLSVMAGHAKVLAHLAVEKGAEPYKQKMNNLVAQLREQRRSKSNKEPCQSLSGPLTQNW
jgi:hypothetical protein